MKHPDLNLIVLFVEVCKQGSIAAAAGVTNIPKSTLSRKIAVFEREIGAPLFHRGRKQLQLTDIGEKTFAEAAKVVAQLEKTHLLARQMQSETRGTLKIGLHTNLGSNWSGRILADFIAMWPDIHVRLEVAGRPLSLRDNLHDVLIHFGHTLDEDLPSRKLVSMRRGYFASRELVERLGRPDSLAALQGFRCIVTEQQMLEGIWSDVSSGFGAHSADIPSVQVNNIGVVRELVVNGAGIGVLPLTICAADLTSGRVVRLFPQKHVPELPVYATYLGKSQAKEKAKIFVNFLVKWFSDNAIG